MKRDDEEKFMRLALAEAEKAGEKGEVPVGAVIVKEKKVLSRGHNQPLERRDPTAHAEIVAIRKAAAKRKNYRLVDCALFVTLEPCAMCLGAVVQARIGKLVFGASDPKGGAVESRLTFPFEKMNHRPEIKGGLLAKECGDILREFFRTKRLKHGKLARR